MNSFCGGGSGVGSVFRDVWCLLEFEAQPEAAWVVRMDVGKMAAFCCKTGPEKGKWAATMGLSGGGCGMVDIGGTLVYPPVGWGGCWSSFSGEGAPPFLFAFLANGHLPFSLPFSLCSLLLGSFLPIVSSLSSSTSEPVFSRSHQQGIYRTSKPQLAPWFGAWYLTHLLWSPRHLIFLSDFLPIFLGTAWRESPLCEIWTWLDHLWRAFASLIIVSTMHGGMLRHMILTNVWFVVYH